MCSHCNWQVRPTERSSICLASCAGMFLVVPLCGVKATEGILRKAFPNINEMALWKSWNVFSNTSLSVVTFGWKSPWIVQFC